MFFLTGFCSLFLFTACSNETNEANEASATPEISVTEPAITLTPVPENDSAVQAVATMQEPVKTTAAPAATPPAGGNTAIAGMNPAHGEPGHRCDIPVGAPLNTPANPAPGASAAPQTQTQIQKTIPPPPAGGIAPAGGSARVNPPHGEPGHDCAVAVGAPLP